MDALIEIVKAYCKLQKIKLNDNMLNAICRNLKKYRDFKAEYDDSRIDSEYEFILSHSKKMILLLEGSKIRQTSVITSKNGKKKGIFYMKGFVFRYIPSLDEFKYIKHLLSANSDNKANIIKNSQQLRKSILNSLNSINYWNRTQYRVIQKFFNVKPEKFVEQELIYGLKRIIKVFTVENKRYYFYEHNVYRKHHKIEFKTSSLDQDNYNYIDEGRHFYDDIYFEFDIDPKLITDELVTDIKNSVESRVFLVTKDIFNKFEDKTHRKKKQEELNEKYKKKFLERVFNGFSYNDIHFSRREIRFENKKLRIFNNNLANFISTKIKFEDKPNFNEIAEDFVSYLDYNHYKNETKIQLGLHAFKVDTKCIQSKNVVFVNDKKILHCDYKDILNEIFRLKSKRDFNRFVSLAETYGYNIAKNCGKDAFVPVTNNEKKEYLNFKLARFNGHLAISALNQSLKLKNCSKLNDFLKKEQYNYAPIFDFIKYLIEDEKYSSETALRFLKEAKSSYSKAEKKSLKYLREAVKETNARRIILELQNEKFKGYRVKGTLSDYFVAEDAKVYRLPGKSYVCIYEPKGNFFINDSVASRLYALKDDANFANSIHTLRKN